MKSNEADVGFGAVGIATFVMECLVLEGCLFHLPLTR